MKNTTRVRKKTFCEKNMSRRFRISDEDAELLRRAERPRVRADCARVERPCPFVSCKYHLFLDVRKNGSLVLNYPDRQPWELEESCVLDIAERGGVTLEGVGELMNLTRERVRQVEVGAMRKLVARMQAGEVQ